MKKIYVLIIAFTLNITTSYTQTTDVVTGMDGSIRMLMVDNILYFSQRYDISYIDINESDPTPNVLISGLITPVGLEIKDNFLYIARFHGNVGGGNGEVIKVDLDDPTPSVIDVISFGNTQNVIDGTSYRNTSNVINAISADITPNMLKFNGNDLYITDNSGRKIYKYDITSNSQIPEIILDIPENQLGGPLGIEIKDNFLYYGQAPGGLAPIGTICKLDINDSIAEPIEVVSGLGRPVGMEFKGDYLYIADMDANKVVKIDVTQSPIVIEDVITNLYLPRDITFDGDVMYISEENKISKIDLSLSVDEFSINDIVLYPNPVKDYLNISNLKSALNFTIYDVNGKSLKRGVVSPNGQINISDLSNGFYLMKFENEDNSIIKIIKN